MAKSRSYADKLLSVATKLRDIAENMEEEFPEDFDRVGVRLEEMAEELEEMADEDAGGEDAGYEDGE